MYDYTLNLSTKGMRVALETFPSFLNRFLMIIIIIVVVVVIIIIIIIIIIIVDWNTQQV